MCVLLLITPAEIPHQWLSGEFDAPELFKVPQGPLTSTQWREPMFPRELLNSGELSEAAKPWSDTEGVYFGNISLVTGWRGQHSGDFENYLENCVCPRALVCTHMYVC